MKVNNLFFICSLFFIFAGCKTLPVTQEKSDLWGMVIDEGNNPVMDFVIICNPDSKNLKTAVTNERGLFVLTDLSFGSYEIRGKKSGYSVYENSEVSFYEPANMFCIQVSSADWVLDNANNLIKAKNYGEALKQVENLCAENHPILEEVITRYVEILGGMVNE